MAEILVAMMLTTLILVMVTSMFISTSKLTMAASQTRNSNGVAANISNSITSVLRVATTLAKSTSAIPDPAIVSGTRSSLTLYSYSNTNAANPAPVKVTFALDGSGNLTETRCTGVASGGFWTFGSCSATSTRTVGTGLLAPTSTADQLFTYRDAGGTPFVIGTGSLSATQRAAVGSIIVTVRAQATGSQTDPVIISSTVVLRNLGLDTGS
jgi:Tfp pilus assembly protein PilW